MVSRLLEAIAPIPIVVQQIAVAEVGDAGTSNLTQTSEGVSVGA